MCTATNPLAEQLMHSATYAGAMLLIGAFALGLDLFARYLGRAGAEPRTVRVVQLAAIWLVTIDAVAIGGLASIGAIRLLWCTL